MVQATLIPTILYPRQPSNIHSCSQRSLHYVRRSNKTPSRRSHRYGAAVSAVIIAVPIIWTAVKMVHLRRRSPHYPGAVQASSSTRYSVLLDEEASPPDDEPPASRRYIQQPTPLKPHMLPTPFDIIYATDTAPSRTERTIPLPRAVLPDASSIGAVDTLSNRLPQPRRRPTEAPFGRFGQMCP